MMAMQQQSLAPQLSYEFTSVNTMVAMAEAGLGIAVLPSVAVPRGTVLTQLRVIRPAMLRTIAVVTIRGHTASPSAARFISMCDLLTPRTAR